MDPILPPARLAAMKAAGYWRDRTILDDFFRCIAVGPERVAVVDHNSMTGERSVLSYAELGRRVERIAAGLARRGVGRGDVVSFQLPNWWQFTALHLAALRLGAVSNPLMPIFREHELGFMLRLAETKLVVVPRVFRGFEHGAMVAARRPEAVRTLRGFLSAGAPIPRALVRRATEHLGADIISAWGMTENGAVTTTKIGDPPEKTFGTDGCALEGMEIRVVDLNGEKLPPDQEGRLQARGAFNFVGYLKRPEWYAADADGWFETGDLARMDADGYVRITGRSKDVIIRGGENIPVIEVEGLIYQHPAVAECAVVAMPDPRLGERVCAFVTLREGQALTLVELSAFLHGKGLARPYFPERLETLPGLPRTPSGKIQKNVLRGIAKEFAAVV